MQINRKIVGYRLDWIWTQSFWSLGTAFLRFTAEGKVTNMGTYLFGIRKYFLQYRVTSYWKINGFAVSGVVVKWLDEGISQRLVPGSSPESRHSGSLFQKKCPFPIIPTKLGVP